MTLVAEPFSLRLVSFLVGRVTGQRPWYGLYGRQGDRGQARSRRVETFCLRLVSFVAGHVTSQRPWYGLMIRETGRQGDRPNPDRLNHFV